MRKALFTLAVAVAAVAAYPILGAADTGVAYAAEHGAPSAIQVKTEIAAVTLPGGQVSHLVVANNADASRGYEVDRGISTKGVVANTAAIRAALPTQLSKESADSIWLGNTYSASVDVNRVPLGNYQLGAPSTEATNSAPLGATDEFAGKKLGGSQAVTLADDRIDRW